MSGNKSYKSNKNCYLSSLKLECQIRVAFLWQTQIETTKYGLYDVMRIKKKEFILTPTVIWAKFLSQRSYSYITFLTKVHFKGTKNVREWKSCLKRKHWPSLDILFITFCFEIDFRQIWLKFDRFSRFLCLKISTFMK